MNESFEDIVTEINNVSDALIFISDSLECHAAEGRSVDLCGLAYLTRLLGGKSSLAADSCWEIFSGSGAGDSGSTDS
jgi:hypothetical protein